jgi:hypothetical protein
MGLLRSAISGGIVDRAIEAEDRKHQDFMRIVSYLLYFVLVSCKSDNVILALGSAGNDFFGFLFTMVTIISRITSKDTLHCQAKPSRTLLQLYHYGMQIFMLRLMMTCT